MHHSGNYKITEDINARYISKIDFQGNIVAENNEKFICGGNASSQVGCNFNFNQVPVVKIIGLKNSIVTFKSIEKLELYANGDNSSDYSLAYNQFYGSVCRKIDLYSEGTEIGWINENVFRIKRVEEVTIDGNYPHNNNHFEHCNLEKGKVNLLNARNNYFSARSEGGVTVETTDKTEVNFLEKEYYYSHYFGNDLDKYAGNTIGFYEINKLQTEQELLKIDQYNKNFPVGALFFNQNGSFRGKGYNAVYKSNLIKLDNIFALKMKTDGAALRVQLNFYDENKNRITTEVDNFADGKMQYYPDAGYSYGIGKNVDNDTLILFPGIAKYVEYTVLFGSNNIESIDLTYIQVKLVKLVNTDVYITNTIPFNVYTQVPNTGYWERGQKLYAKNPTPGTYTGIICTEAGTPGTWKNFAQIQS